MSVLGPYLGPHLSAITRAALPQAFAELNLLAPTLDPRISFTGGPVTYVGADGLLHTSAANEWPLEYDPVTLLPKGRTPWEARTNLLTWSSDATNVSWSKDFATVGSLVVGPDGLKSALVVNETTDPQYHRMGRQGGTLSTTAGQVYSAFFIIAKLGRKDVFIRTSLLDGGTYRNIAFDLDSVAVGYTPAGHTASIQRLANGFFKLSVTFTATATVNSGGLYLCASSGPVTTDTLGGYAGDVTKGFVFYAAQLEAATPGPYIPTTNAEVTRAAQVATVNDLSTLRFNAAAGTLFVEAFTPTDSGVLRGIVGFDDNTNANRIMLRREVNNDAIAQVVSSAGSAGSTVAGALAGSSVRFKYAIGYNAAGSKAAVGGVLGSTGAALTMPVVNRLRVGTAMASSYWNAPIRRIRYYPRKLSDAELQVLTA